ncbi:MAG: MmgE/PrpD family protein [Deltaproteobacteria bacterium]|nr:MmgE/PrpD family protein [Deltaproteobacteria bacterium]MBW2562644.1 MmgE/PrpD family protein [Deltaproteobacteria bacterium]
MENNEITLNFIMESGWSKLPENVQHQAKRCLMDTLGALIAGHNTPVADLINSFVKEQFKGDDATILVKGSKISASGAALVNGFANNALDIDDGYRSVKGHPGACILPVALAAAEIAPGITGDKFLTALVVGYEVAIRAGLIRHATYETYHSSGSWGAIGGAAAAGKILGLSREKLCHALGAAEYHAPIAPMMKCIEIPGMGKDSIGWGCMVAIMSVLMAERGFTGIDPIFNDSPKEEWIQSLGRSYQIMNLYFKPYSACRWAQPGVDGALKIMLENSLDHEDIKQIKVFTFKESAELSTDYPQNTEEAQYNIAFPIAAALMDGEVGPDQVLAPRLFEEDIHRMMDKISIIAQDRFQKEFPAKAESEVEITTTAGSVFSSGVMSARWDPHSTFPKDLELENKFLWLVSPVLGKTKAESLVKLIWNFDREEKLDSLIDLCIVHK